MGDAEQFVKDLVGTVRPLLKAPASLVKAEREWSLSSICAVIDARNTTPQVVTSAIGTINSVVVASSALDSPLLQAFLKRARVSDPETALAESLERDDAEAFAEVYARYLEEREENGHAVWSVGDSAAFAAKSREAWNDRELACVAITPGPTASTHGVLTFSLPLDWLS
jgi:hypothetical protein